MQTLDLCGAEIGQLFRNVESGSERLAFVAAGEIAGLWSGREQTSR